MFKHQYKILIFIICGLTAYFGVYQVSTEKNTELVNSYSEKPIDIISDISIATLLEISGISKQVKQFPALFKGSMQQSAQQGMVLSLAEYTAITQSIDNSILPSIILKGISAKLKSELKQNDAEVLIAWYQSTLGKKIANAEENSQTESAYQAMVEQKTILLSNTERVAFAERLDILVGATKMTNKIQQNVQMAVNSNIELALSPDRGLDTVALKIALGLETKINLAIEQMVIISFVYSYQSLSIEELTQYETFLNQNFTKKFNKVILSGINSGLENAILSWLDSSAVSLSTIEPNDDWE